MGKPRVILADPPWMYRVWSKATGSGRSAESHYPTMSIADLMALPVASLAAKDCALLMWVTWPGLLEAIAVGEAWGFQYKTCGFLFAKTNKRAVDRWTTVDDAANWFMGLGYYTRANTEPCLLFMRGSIKRRAADVPQLIVAPITVHSAKPQAQYERIERLFEGPYCELFARQTRPGWLSLGNEIDGQDIRQSLAQLTEEI